MLFLAEVLSWCWKTRPKERQCWIALKPFLIVNSSIINAKDITNCSKGKQNKKLFLNLSKEDTEKKSAEILPSFVKHFCVFVSLRATWKKNSSSRIRAWNASVDFTSINWLLMWKIENFFPSKPSRKTCLRIMNYSPERYKFSKKKSFHTFLRFKLKWKINFKLSYF